MNNSQDTTQKTNFLGEQKIFPLLLKMGIPAAIGMLVNALYNVIDTVFVGRGVGALAIGALSLVFPIQVIVTSVAMGIGIGAASIASRRLGEKQPEKAAAAMGTAYSAVVIGTVILMVVLMLFTEPILRLFGTTETLMPYSVEYTQNVAIGFLFFALSILASTLLRSEGKSREAMNGMILGAVANCILDPVFIFIFKLGVRGAAIATVISQLLACLYFLSIYLRRKNSVKMSLSDFKINWPVLRESSALGIPAFVQQAGMSILALVLNNSLGFYGGDTAIVNYGMVHKFMTLVILPTMGIVQGFQPIAGYNYGAQKYDRVKKSIWVTILTSLILLLTGYSFMMLIPGKCMGLFTTDRELIASSAHVMRIMVRCLPLIALQFTGSVYFQAVGKPKEALVLGLSRQFIILIPLVIILPRILGLDGIFMSYPISDVVSTVVTGLFLLKELKKLGKKHELSLAAC